MNRSLIAAALPIAALALGIRTALAAPLPAPQAPSPPAPQAAPAGQGVATGTLQGQVIDLAGAPVAGATLVADGLEWDAVSGADGRFSLPLPAGTWTVRVSAPGFEVMEQPGVVISAGRALAQDMMLIPAEDAPAAQAAAAAPPAAGADAADDAAAQELDGVSVTAQAPVEEEGSQLALTVERQDSTAVLDVLSSEQITRAGDSDAAGALKRVTGLTLRDGKFIYVRGMGERYSSVLVNGAQVPSPDPTRRVVPLDLFPTGILDGVVVQKSYSADMPGEFGGGTIQLRTRGLPEEGFLRLSGTLGYAEGTSFERGITSQGGGRDWTGRDDGSRAPNPTLESLRLQGRFLRPQSFANPDGLTPAQLEAVGEALPNRWDLEETTLGPDTGLGISGGQRWDLGEDWSVGVLAATRYANGWDTREERRRNFSATSGGLSLRDDLQLETSTNTIELSQFLTAGAEYGEDHAITFTSMLLRITEDEARVTTGSQDSQDVLLRSMEWVENELFLNQLGGEHTLRALGDTLLTWQYSDARARRDAPDSRQYRYELDAAGTPTFSSAAGSNSLSWQGLVDDSRNLDLALRTPFAFGEMGRGNVAVVAGRLDRDRDSDIRRYGFQARGPLATDPAVIGNPSLGGILVPGTIGPTGFELIETTQPTDNYTAEQTLDWVGVSLDATFADRLRVDLGAREETNLQRVRTFSAVRPNDPPIVGTIDRSDVLPAAGVTWFIGEEGAQQLRFNYGETLSRPDFRELTPAPFLDPVIDVLTVGNPDLRQTSIKHYDLRWEWYGAGTDSLSVGLFRKEFVDPIEKARAAGSGELLVLFNAQGATNDGIEIEFSKPLDFMYGLGERMGWAGAEDIAWENWTIGGNWAFIDSEVQIDPRVNANVTNTSRPLEGTARTTFNLSLGYLSLEGDREATFLYNVTGDRLSQVGIAGQPDIYEEAFHQLDFSYRQQLAEDWSLRVRLRNLLDPKVEFTQGDQVTREYRRGREVSVTLEWSPF
jgi:hypothetical protein